MFSRGAAIIGGIRTAHWRGVCLGAVAPMRAFTILIGLLAFCVSSRALEVNEIRFWSLGEITRVVVQFDGEFRYKWARLDNPPRVFFDLPDATLAIGSSRDRGRLHVIEVNDPVLRQIRYAENTPGSSRVVLDLAGNFEFTASQLANPPRLIIELRGKGASDGQVEVSRTGSVGTQEDSPSTVALATLPASTPPPAEPVATDRGRRTPEPSQPDRKATGPKSARPSIPPVSSANSASVVPGVTSQDIPRPPEEAPRKPSAPSGSQKSEAAAVVAANVEKPKPVADEPGADEGPAPAVAKPAARTATGQQSLIRALGLKIGKVVIDPGHGGKDQGTTGVSGLLEKDLVLDIARRLKGLVEEQLGSEVILTRDGDSFIPLEERTAIANRQRADVFVSLHANSSPFRLASGSETFFLDFTSSRESMDIAARENASSTKSVADLQDIVKRIALKDKRDESRDFASKMQSAIFKSQRGAGTAKKNRGVKSAPFIVLVGAEMPSILVEIGFLSNKKEEEALKTGDYRQKIAQAIFDGLQSYVSSLSHFEAKERAAREE